MPTRRQVVNHYPRCTQLAATFPTLRNPDIWNRGFEPFDARKIQRNLGHAAHSNASRMAALFVLSVFNSGHDWKSPLYRWVGDVRKRDGYLRFNVVRAFGTWDDRHCAAFLAWARAPWFA
jgi:hypothetical protein